MLWYVKSRKDLLFLDATDRVPVRAVAAAHADISAVEVEVAGAGTVRSRRPIVAVATPTIRRRTIEVAGVEEVVWVFTEGFSGGIT